LCKPLAISDPGPFESIGREIGPRYGWRKSENVTQQDGFFVTSNSLVAVELKLGSTSWPDQIAKYVALMICEEGVSGPRQSLGLLFNVPEPTDHWATVGLDGPQIDATFVNHLNREKLPKKIQNLFEQQPDQVASVLERLRLAVISWRAFREEIATIENELSGSEPGNQTLQRLLAGLHAQIDAHDKTGLEASKILAF
jgi:hypothetical protein